MCGILGFYHFKNAPERPVMQAAGQAMARALVYRGPDDEGLWQDPDLPLLLGQRRLAIVDLSQEGHQPKESYSGRYVTTYNGEIYNFRELTTELESAGVKFKGRSDTEVLLAACDVWGVSQTLQKINGMFAIILWDRQERQLHLVRDRLGKKPLYAGWSGQALVMASELKAFHAFPGCTPEIDRDVLALYMRYGCVPAPFCIYKNIWQLLPGCRVTLSLKDLKGGQSIASLMEPYWHLPRVTEEAQIAIRNYDDAAAIKECEALLSACVGERMIADVPLGAFLSGGIDSSLVTALMQAQSVQPVKTFSIGFREQGYDEAAHAAQVAKHLGTDHRELYVSSADAQSVVPELPDIYDEPFADVSQIPSILLARFARQHVTVALSGDGGDELFGGYVRHAVLPQMWQRTGFLPLPLRRALSNMISTVPAETWSRLVPQRPQFGEKMHKAAEIMACETPAQAYGRVISLWDDPECLVADGREPVIPLRDPAWQPQGLGFAESMMYGDALSYLPNDVLTKVDRATMASSLEARAPLLDRRMYEFAWSLPACMKIRNGQGKWLLRRVLARHVPEDMFTRPKQGFTVPIGAWLRGPLRPWAEDMLSTPCGFLDNAAVQQAWQDHLAGGGRNAHKIWAALMFRAWHKRWK